METVNEIANRFRIASRIATSIEAFAARQRMDVEDVLASADPNSWRMFGMLAGCRDEYTPSTETRVFVVEIIRDHGQALCVDCGLRQAEVQDAAAQKQGKEICPACWSKKYAHGEHAQVRP